MNKIVFLLFSPVAAFNSQKPQSTRPWTEKVYGQEMKIRILIKSCVSLAAIPSEDVIMGFNQVCSASDSFSEFKSYLEYFKETWLGSPGRLGKVSQPLFSIILWNQFENAVNGNQKTNKNFKDWHRAFQLGMGFVHRTCSIYERSRASLKTALHEYEQEKFFQSPPACSANSRPL